MKYFIITGASKGLGKAITDKLLLENENKIFAIARSSDETHLSQGVKYFNMNLCDSKKATGLISSILSSIAINPSDEFYLINNAGMINPIKTIENTDVDDLIDNIHLNLISTMLLTGEFIKFLEKSNVKKRVLNISSGAARRPVTGWNVYCSAKAGVDMFTQTVALEQNAKEFPTHLMAIAPGIIDTGMQETIRSADLMNFRDLEQFKNFKSSGKLMDSSYVAKGVLKLLLGEEFINGDITRVENYL